MEGLFTCKGETGPRGADGSSKDAFILMRQTSVTLTNYESNFTTGNIDPKSKYIELQPECIYVKQNLQFEIRVHDDRALNNLLRINLTSGCTESYAATTSLLQGTLIEAFNGTLTSHDIVRASVSTEKTLVKPGIRKALYLAGSSRNGDPGAYWWVTMTGTVQEYGLA